MSPYQRFIQARDFLQPHRTDYEHAYHGYIAPALTEFNWALDYFDVAGARQPDRRRCAWSARMAATVSISYAEMAERSNRVANWLRAAGVARGDRVLLMLPNRVELWELMLAGIKLGAVVVPTSMLAMPADLRDRFERGAGAPRHRAGAARRRKFDGAVDGDFTRIAVGAAVRRLARLCADSAGAPSRFRARRRHAGARSAAAVLHLRHHGPAQAGAAHATRAIRSATCRRCTGSACSRATCTGTSPRPAGPSMPGAASSRRGTPAPPSSSSTTRASTRRRALDVHRALRRHLAVRAADRLAHADPGGPGAVEAAAARAGRRRRAAESRGHRAGARSAWGLTHPRRLRPDRDHRADRQHAGPAGQARLDGPAAARLPHRAARRRRPARPTRARSPSLLEPDPVGLMPGYDGEHAKTAEVMRGGYYHTGDVAPPRRRRLLPMSAAPTTSSSPPTTASARSSWKAC